MRQRSAQIIHCDRWYDKDTLVQNTKYDMYYTVFVISVVAYYITTALVSKKLNDNVESWNWFWMLLVLQMAPVWPIVVKLSKNLVFDSMLYDFLLMATYWITLFYLGSGKNLTTIQWTSVVMILSGLLLFKIGGQ